jgi:DNA repair exonuclease SbcCD ATPase subunit
MEDLQKILENYHNIDKKLEVVSELLKQHLEDDTSNLQRIVTSLDSIDSRLHDNTAQLDKNTFQLEVHIQGVREAQENNRILREQLLLYKEEVAIKLAELEKPQIVAKGIMWIIGSLTALVALLVALKELF